MPRATDPERDRRITMEIIVDCYSEEEVMLGWYYYLEERLGFPFQATCTRKIETSPLEVGQTVSVTGIASEEVCVRQDQIIVLVRYGQKNLGVPLDQLEPADADSAERIQALEDWHYWRGN